VIALYHILKRASSDRRKQRARRIVHPLPELREYPIQYQPRHWRGL
jgi:hypothetical protein